MLDESKKGKLRGDSDDVVITKDECKSMTGGDFLSFDSATYTSKKIKAMKLIVLRTLSQKFMKKSLNWLMLTPKIQNNGLGSRMLIESNKVTMFFLVRA